MKPSGAIGAIWVLALALPLTLVPALASAQVAAPPAAPPAAPGGAPAATASPAAPVPAPGMRIVTGQAAVVGGNSAAARDRALDDAVKQAVDAAVTDLVDPATRIAQAKAIKAIVARARSFVPRYRTLEEGEVSGVYSIRLEAEVDEAALRAKLERPSASTVPTPVRAGPAQVAVLPGDHAEASTAFASALATALAGAGIRARAAEVAAAGEIPTRVTAEVTDEGPLRGVSRASLLCRGVARMLSPVTGSTSELTAAERAFVAAGTGERPDTARGECAARLASSLLGRVRAALVASDAASGPGGDLRPVTVDADIVEPAAIPALLRALRSVGAVSSVELTRVADGRAELKARTRATAAALSAALSRDAASVITLSDVAVSGDTIHVKARMRNVPAPSDGAGGGSSMKWVRETLVLRTRTLLFGALLSLSCAQTLSSNAIAVRVQCNVPDATVWIDDVLVGTTSSWRAPRQIRAGFHRVEIRHPGYYSFFQEVELPGGSDVIVNANLRELVE